ncbi:hypothetical protein ACFVYD_15310 [Streptomyces sp. NPDC058301]|uniref:hypothetical protein n=1 Tax=Streptomyces sp. NPDC058301 TaxID=3346436 RepID=UPI0036E6E779
MSRNRTRALLAAPLLLAPFVTGVAVAPAAQADPAPAAARTVAWPDTCGNHVHVVAGTYYRYWGNCINSGERIKIDYILWPDKTVCVPGAADFYLGTQGQVRGATQISGC